MVVSVGSETSEGLWTRIVVFGLRSQDRAAGYVGWSDVVEIPVVILSFSLRVPSASLKLVLG